MQFKHNLNPKFELSEDILDEAHLDFLKHDIGIAQCDECSAYVHLDRIPYEDLLFESQNHPWGSTVAIDTYVIGFICPNCNATNKK